MIGQFNETSVWDFAGLDDTIYVGLIDDGLEEHEDLPYERIDFTNGWDFAENEWDVTPGDLRAHGMGCVGIIGASHTMDSVAGQQVSSGVISMNPNIEILPIAIFDTNGVPATEYEVAAAINYAWKTGAEVVSNSWGWRDGTTSWPEVNAALDSAHQFGRNGKGCLMIFATGNSAPKPYPMVAYPANYPTTLAVGAIQLDDWKFNYSQGGPTLDLLAPSGPSVTCTGDVWTLDRMELFG